MKSHRLLLSALILFQTSQLARAGSATWNLNPTSGDWNTAANWTPATVPGSTDVATFGVSNLPTVLLGPEDLINTVMFDSTASAYVISTNPEGQSSEMFVYGGITNDSSVVQNFVLTTDDQGGQGNITFFHGSAGSRTAFLCEAGTFPGRGGGSADFIDDTSAGEGVFTTEGVSVAGGSPGQIDFFTNSTADNATCVNNGATVSGGAGGITYFSFRSTAANSYLIANGGTNGGAGGQILFDYRAAGGTTRVALFGNGFLSLNGVQHSLSIGSLEGDGMAKLFGKPLTVGTNDLSTVFSGIIDETGGSGPSSVTKVGSGTLTLSGANLYSGGTVINEGELMIANTEGSATGTGSVQVNAGTLSGSGTIVGGVTVGTDSSTGAFLAPAGSTGIQATLGMQSSLSFNADATYTCTFKAKKKQSKTDKVIANGVTINSGAMFSLSGITRGTLTQGLILSVIRNTAATPIAGTFSNLPDGGILTVNGNNFQANYEGGDGNDLTLTVVP